MARETVPCVRFSSIPPAGSVRSCRTEGYHRPAAESLTQWASESTLAVTTNYVLVEVVSLFVSRVRTPRAEQVKVIEAIRASDAVAVVHVDQELDAAAWQLFKQRPDKQWTIVDCASFVVMQRRAITEALTSDHHFEQAGFVRLLGPG